MSRRESMFERFAWLVRGRRTAGQSLVEFAIILPVFLLLVAGAIDLGRLFSAYVSTENAAKEGALYGATNPRCDAPKQGCTDPSTVRWHVLQELGGVTSASPTAECLRGGAAIAVTSCAEGDRYRVTVRHSFALLTPILAPIFGSTIELRSRATALVVNDAFDPTATPISLPSPTPVPTPTPTASATGSVAPSASPTASPAPTPTPPQCIVPNFSGQRKTDAQPVWEAAAFTTNVTIGPGSGNYRIGSQSLQAGSDQPCSSSITVGP